MDSRRNNCRDDAVRTETHVVTRRLLRAGWLLTDFLSYLLVTEVAIAWLYMLSPRFSIIRFPNEFSIYCMIVGGAVAGLLLLVAGILYLEKEARI